MFLHAQVIWSLTLWAALKFNHLASAEEMTEMAFVDADFDAKILHCMLDMNSLTSARIDILFLRQNHYF